MMKERNNKRYKTKYAGVHYRIKKNGDKSYVVTLFTGKEITIKDRDYAYKYEVINEKIAFKIKLELDQDIKNQAMNINKFKMTMSDLLDYYIKNKDIATINDHSMVFKKHFIPIFGDKKLSQITKFDFTNLSTYLKKVQIKNLTKAVYISHFITMLKFGERHDLFNFPINSNLLARPKVREEEKVRKQFITLDDLKKILEHEDIKNNEMLSLYFKLLFTTGTRGGNLYMLQLKDIDFTENSILFKPFKNAKEYKVYLDKSIIDLISVYAKNNNIELEDYIFHDGKKDIKKEWKKFYARVIYQFKKVMPDYALHSLRKGFAMFQVYENNVPRQIVSGQLNHASSIMLDRHYAYVDEKKLKEYRLKIDFNSL